jgi:cobalt/nickel transport system permease protein
VTGHHTIAANGVAADPGSAVRALDPRAKLAGLLVVSFVAVSTPLRSCPVWVACAAVLAAYAVAGRVPARLVWRRARLVLPPVLLAAAFVPLVRTGGAAHAIGPLTVHDAGLAVAAAATAKATIGTLSAVLLGATATFPELLRGLEALRVPRLLVLIAAFMYRYLFVIGDEVGRMRAALRARGYAPRTALGAGATGRLAGALFLRAHARGERVYLAMLARGYAGSVPHLRPLALGGADVAFVALVLVALVPLRLAG